MYETETKEAILDRMLERIDSDIDKRQGAVAWDLTSPASFEFAQAYLALDQVLTFGFATEDTPSNYLDLRCAEMGVYRKPSVKAIGQVTFSGPEGTIIPVGTRVRTDEVEPVYFVTTAEGTIVNGTVMVSAEAEVGGVSGNIAQGKISLVLGELAGIVTVTNAQAFDGGVDTESDLSLLSRYNDKVSKPVTSGNKYHYEQWAKEVAGVGDAKVYPLHAGPGTVKIVLLDDEKTSPAQTIVDAANTHINNVAPIGATITVVGATELPINVSATLTLAQGADINEVTTQFSEALSAYLKSVAFTDELIRYTQIANLLLGVPPIIDYANLTVNGGTANIQPTSEQVGVVGSVVFT
ncbi:baseplate J/gp47 family protein [Bacillus sp. JJ1503]|uniref:baseplate J/gp47 family protein n=1 Tax=Bacillus sp. JJ1503 TaxID=3122956 RepID=UPI0030009621